MINADNGIINLRERLMEADRKKPQSAGVSVSPPANHEADSANKSRKLADIIEIRNENKIAVLGPVRSEDTAREILSLLKEQFTAGDENVRTLHRRANADAAMVFYPFE